MAGRLRTQLKNLEAIREAADELYSLIHKAAPKGLITSESILERIRGELADEKAELWHKMLDGAFDCSDSAMQLEDMVEARLRKLPTYRPPAPPAQPTLPPASPADSSLSTAKA